MVYYIILTTYAAPDSLLKRLNSFVNKGGHVVYSFKSGFSDQNVKVRTCRQPGIISEACGISYSLFSVPQNVSLKGDPFGVGEANNKITTWMELITPTTAKVLACYDHPAWGSYAAITQNIYGKGTATYVGCMTSNQVLEKILANEVKNAGLWGDAQKLYFPVITKDGLNDLGKRVRYIFNYSSKPISVKYTFGNGHELLLNKTVDKNTLLELEPWGMKIIEEK